MLSQDDLDTDLQRAGGTGALVAAGTFLVGIALFASSLSDYTSGDSEPAESVLFLVDNEALMYVWNTVIFVVFGIVLVPLVLALRDRLADVSPGLARMSAAFGLIWVGLVIAAGMIANVGWADVIDRFDTDPEGAVTLWSSVDTIQNGVGGGNEIVGGVWVLLVSVAALRTGVLPRALSYLGVVCGVAGLVTVVPGLEDVGAIFGLGLIVWFVWIGTLLVKDPGTA